MCDILVIDYSRFLEALQLPTPKLENVTDFHNARTRRQSSTSGREGGEGEIQEGRRMYLPIGESRWKTHPMNFHPVQNLKSLEKNIYTCIYMCVFLNIVYTPFFVFFCQIFLPHTTIMTQ
jgi:hypothetical protein